MKTAIYKRAETTEELDQILTLQKKNLPRHLSPGEIQNEGFLTVEHDMIILNAMNLKCAHVIAEFRNRVVGYALCMHPDFRHDIPVLRSMFDQIDSCLGPDPVYMVMGQICIDKAFRKKGLFRGMYNFMRDQLKDSYDQIITEVDLNNMRSLKAHYAIGFKILSSYRSEGRQWKLLNWPLY